MTTLAHMSMANGYLSHAKRDALDDVTLARARATLAKALDAAPLALSGDLAGCTLALKSAGGALEGSLFWAIDGGQTVPLLVFGVAPSTRDGQVVWSRLAKMVELLPVPTPLQEPTDPWLASLPLPTLMYMGVDLPDIDDAVARLQEALAWTWLEGR